MVDENGEHLVTNCDELIFLERVRVLPIDFVSSFVLILALIRLNQALDHFKKLKLVEHAENKFESFLRVLATFLQLGHLKILLFLKQLSVLFLADIEAYSARDFASSALNFLKAFLNESHSAFGHFCDLSRPPRPSLLLLNFPLIAFAASHRIRLLLNCTHKLVILRGFGGCRSDIL